MIVSTLTLWETDDRSRLVPDLHPDSRFLFCVPGDELDGARAARYTEYITPKAEAKAVETPAETKQVTAKQTKSGGK
jgi:hypothetical protein